MQQDSRALELVRRQEVLAAERGVWESHWQEIAELFTPFRADFQGSRTPGGKRTSKVFDGTPGLAAENLAAGLWGLLTNSANTWFQLRHEDEALNDDQAVKVWLDEAGRRLLGAFASGGQRFYARVVDLFSDLVHFGTAVFYVDEVPGQRGLYFSCRHLAECFIAENEQEQVDTLFRRFAMTARQVALRFPETLGVRLKEQAQKRPDERVELLHAVLPAREYDGDAHLRGGDAAGTARSRGAGAVRRRAGGARGGGRLRPAGQGAARRRGAGRAARGRRAAGPARGAAGRGQAGGGGGEGHGRRGPGGAGHDGRPR